MYATIIGSLLVYMCTIHFWGLHPDISYSWKVESTLAAAATNFSLSASLFRLLYSRSSHPYRIFSTEAVFFCFSRATSMRMAKKVCLVMTDDDDNVDDGPCNYHTDAGNGKRKTTTADKRTSATFDYCNAHLLFYIAIRCSFYSLVYTTHSTKSV